MCIFMVAVCKKLWLSLSGLDSEDYFDSYEPCEGEMQQETTLPMPEERCRRDVTVVLMTQARTAVLFSVTSQTASQWSRAVTPMRCY